MPATSQIAFARLADGLGADIDAALQSYLVFDDGCPAELSAAIHYSALGPGKRLRPILVLLAAEACGSTIGQAMPAACAVEMVHAYSLIHDDLPAMDDDDLRRGRPTCHKVYDEATAILAGDALLTRAFEVLADEIRPAETATRCCATLARAAGATGMVGGQASDLAAEGGGWPQDTDAAIRELQSVHRRKTGAMFVASLRLGGLTAQAGETELRALTDFGDHLGLAFQIVDDLLDVAGDETATGKRVQKDQQRGKLTYPALVGVDQSRCQARQAIEQACQALVPFGVAAAKLEALARFVIERDR